MIAPLTSPGFASMVGQAGARAERRDWGLVERDRSSGRVVGLEYWDASRRLPRELLDALPTPPVQEIAVEQQTA